MMKTLVALIFLGLTVSVCEALYCKDHHDCPKTKCCINIFFNGLGDCYDYNKEGEKCKLSFFLNCGCMPGLKCVTVDESKDATTGVCKDTSKATATTVQPDSGTTCSKDRKCPSDDECCVGRIDFTGLGSMAQKGVCKKSIQEGATCLPEDSFACGCAHGLVCDFPETPKDGAAPRRVCMKK